jgi:hypothetical protein
MKKLAALLLLSFSAQADYIYMGGWSHHLTSGEYNEEHHFHAYQKYNWLIGGFVNSFDDYTLMAGKSFNWTNESKSLEAGFVAGLSYGYKHEDVKLSINGFLPVLVPYVTYTQYKVQPSLLLLGNAIALTFRIEL